ncbi:MAG: DUF4389 domain-containing protein [Chloroflexi bacterium]|nr:DUF4389 domain-containing protein [Chloroflexota bacterium]
MAQPASQATYPLSLTGKLDEPLNRWLPWVKWLLALPHWVVLAVLFVLFAILTIFAFFAILFTGRYPKGIFDFNVGVLRWGWRVGFYTYMALGTDKYPPFSLVAASQYPAELSIEYPPRLSRGLVLVKWWLLAIPHYLVIAIFQGGVRFIGMSVGLLGLLVLFVAVVLLFTQKYPRDLFDFIMGINRWTYRAFAYALLLTDRYPPFRLGE